MCTNCATNTATTSPFPTSEFMRWGAAPGSTIDHATYLVPKGSADIFFPTDFEALSRLYTMAAASSDGSAPASSGAVASEYHNVADFMYTYADWKATSTMSGYNPLLEDFTNTMIFMGNMDGANVKQR